MDMIMIEKSDFDKLIGRIEEIAEHIRKSENKRLSVDAERWISNREAMDILGVSPRTLQRYRDSGCIPFSKIGRNCRYRLSDIERALEMYMIDGTAAKPDVLHRQYLIRTRKMYIRPEKT
ncbi:helix-turn-helix domain-containing protein [Alistipes finegoldii]|uniref:helix-turn-helix domain-containing protein n=1 Tax=Alistipes finegoldii TaxID=214856 RepID=UPI0024955EDD|nr:helix-turn-helix domain-containing protein [Alistipes finegoldii]